MCARETAELLVQVGRLVHPLLRPRQPVLPEPIGIRGVSSDHPRHRNANHQIA